MECRNPCQTIPYRVRSPAEQEIVLTFQAIEKAVVAHDAAEWGKHVADEFVRYGTGQTPVPKSERIATIERQKEANSAVVVGEIETMRLAVYGDGAAMTASQTLPDNSRPPFARRVSGSAATANGSWRSAFTPTSNNPSVLFRRETAERRRQLSSPGRHVLVLAFELHAGGERHGFGERGKILLQIFLRILLQHRGAEMALQHFARSRRHRQRHINLAAKLKTEIEVLAQQLGRERRGPIQIDQAPAICSV